jgi:hypothetical protein
MVEVLPFILSRGDKSIQIRFPFFHALPRATIAFRALLSPLFYVRWKIRFPSPTPQFKALAQSQITCKSAKSQFNDFLICFPHVSRSRIAIDVHRGTDVRVPHQLLVHSHRRTYRIQPCAIAVTKTMRTDVP